ncbi:MAG TPA: hypothetical protein PLP01_04885 [Phycisphaerae bacterium]|mgnify:FL=1|nr:hypothetical protein [Phycisphaerae bacterium]
MTAARKKPSWLWFLGAVFVLLAGLVFFGLNLYRQITGMVGGYDRHVTPDTWTMNVEKPGRVVVYHEYWSVFGGKSYRQTPHGVGLRVAVRRDGSEVLVRPYPGDANYSLNQVQGVAESVFDAESPGQYTITVDADEPTVVAVGRDMVGPILGMLFGSAALCIGSFLAALAIIIVTLVRMSRYKAAARQA